MNMEHSLKTQLYYDKHEQLQLLLPDLQGKPSQMAVRNGMVFNLLEMLLEYSEGYFYGQVYKHGKGMKHTGISFTETELIKLLNGGF